jgi:pimeloyl-ACP methyl ester carboxylesterase
MMALSAPSCKECRNGLQETGVMVVDIFGMWLRGFFAVAVLGLGLILLGHWHEELPTTQDTVSLVTFAERFQSWRPGFDQLTACFGGGTLLLLFGLAGRWWATPTFWRRHGDDEPRHEPAAETRRLRRPDGTILHVEFHGPVDAPPLVLTHGWGCDHVVWHYLKRELGDKYRLILWDLPGLGRSTQPANRDYSLEKMARDLNAVIGLAGRRPVTLVGYSMGGMIMLTHAKLFPEALGPRVAGMILVNTTYTNPLRTMKWGWLFSAFQKPIAEPLAYLTIAASPLLRVLNFLSYLNGSAHRSSARQEFAGTETRGQLDLAAWYYVQSSPAVIARGLLGMFRYDATEVLSSIPVPALAVVGEGDQVTPPDVHARICIDIPRCDLATLGPARHLAMVERHEEFAELVDQFCDAYGTGEVRFVNAHRTVEWPAMHLVAS